MGGREWRQALPFPERSLIFLAVPDQHLAGMARELAPALTAEQALIHLSGALPLAALEPAPRRGAFHPLQSFPAPRSREHFEGITIGLEASEGELLAALEALAAGLGARPRRVTDEQRVLYHAAAVTAGTYLVALAGTAVDILAAIGWSREEALDSLLTLIRGTVANLEQDRLPGALIGPIRRGDAATVERQLRALRGELPEAAGVYRALGLRALGLAREAGLDEASAKRLEAVLGAA